VEFFFVNFFEVLDLPELIGKKSGRKTKKDLENKMQNIGSRLKNQREKWDDFFQGNGILKLGVISIKTFLTIITVICFSLGGQAASVNGELIVEFYNEMFTPDRLEEGLSGAVFMVVQDGEIVFLDGYGLANREKNIEIHPEKTRFRIGSVSKLFTATALMKLVEEGRVDLDRDIKEYLPWLDLQGDYSKPITPWHLLTHTAGFDERAIGMVAEDFREVIPLRDYIEESLPPRIEKPGVLPQYSNHGMALAALLVESVTGMDFDRYVQEHIFFPLEMTATSPRLQEQELKDIAREYIYSGDEFIPRPLYDFNFPPVGSIVSTAPDMAKFINLFLEGNEQVINEETAQKMLEREFFLHPRMPGIGLGFFELVFRDHTFIGHGGDTLGSHSFLLLEPEGRTGFFISSTGSAAPLLVRDVIEGISKTFYREWAQGEPEIISGGVEEDKLLGIYRANRFSRTDLFRFMTLLQPNPRIAAGGDGKLKMITPERETNLHPVEEDLFVNLEQGYYVFFGSIEDGNRNYKQFNFPIIVYEKLAWYENNQIHLVLLGISIIIFLSGLIIFGLVPLIRRRKKKTKPKFFYLSGLVSLIQVSWLVIILISVARLGDFMYLGFGLPFSFHLGRILFFAAISLTIPCIFGIFHVWSRSKGGFFQRLLFSFVTGASLVYSLIFLLYRFPYF